MKQSLARKLSELLERSAMKSAASNKSLIGAPRLPKELKKTTS